MDLCDVSFLCFNCSCTWKFLSIPSVLFILLGYFWISLSSSLYTFISWDSLVGKTYTLIRNGGSEWTVSMTVMIWEHFLWVLALTSPTCFPVTNVQHIFSLKLKFLVSKAPKTHYRACHKEYWTFVSLGITCGSTIDKDMQKMLILCQNLLISLHWVFQRTNAICVKYNIIDQFNSLTHNAYILIITPNWSLPKVIQD